MILQSLVWTLLLIWLTLQFRVEILRSYCDRQISQQQQLLLRRRRLLLLLLLLLLFLLLLSPTPPPLLILQHGEVIEADWKRDRRSSWQTTRTCASVGA